jgi:acyl carrier protein
MSERLRDRLLAFVRGLPAVEGRDLDHRSPLISSGMVDSASLVELAAWIDRETDSRADLTEVDLVTEWDTVDDIARFMEQQIGPRDG